MLTAVILLEGIKMGIYNPQTKAAIEQHGPWSDYNRFNQGGVSQKTSFPEETNYSNKMLWLEDMDKAESREEARLDWLEEQRIDAQCSDEDDEGCHNWT